MRWRIILFLLHLSLINQTFFMIRSILLNLEKNYLLMVLLLRITLITRGMSFLHVNAERKILLFLIPPFYHLIIIKRYRVKFLAYLRLVRSWGCLYLRSWTFWSWMSWPFHRFIFSKLIFPLSIFLSHWFFMIYLLLICNFRKMSRHFSLSWWLCQVLLALSLVPI